MKVANDQVKQYLIEGVTDLSAYDVTATTEQEKLQAVRQIFEREYLWRVDQVGAKAALTEYLQGLPTWADYAYMWVDVDRLGIDWGYVSENSNKSIDAFERRYWTVLSYNLWQLLYTAEFDRYGRALLHTGSGRRHAGITKGPQRKIEGRNHAAIH